MFVKVGRAWVNLENVIEIRLGLHNKYYWEFITNGSIEEIDKEGNCTKTLKTIKIWFDTKDEAIKWFEENIEPALNDYNNARRKYLTI